MKNIFEILGKLKMYATRAISYISVINAAMLVFLVISQLRSLGLDFNFKLAVAIGMPMFFLGIMILGYIDHKSGIYAAESAAFFRRNPEWKEMMDRLKRIEDDKRNME